MSKQQGIDIFFKWFPVLMGLLSLAYSWGMIHSEVSSIRVELKTMITHVITHESRISKIEGQLE